MRSLTCPYVGSGFIDTCTSLVVTLTAINVELRAGYRVTIALGEWRAIMSALGGFHSALESNADTGRLS